MLKKTEIEILRQFTLDLNGKKNIKEISDEIKKPYPLIHRTVQSLVKEGYLLRDEHNLLFLNLKNYSELAYIEALKTKDFLKKNKKFSDFLDNIKSNFFTLIFSEKDFIAIAEDKLKIKGIKVFSKEEAINMFSRIKDDNILNKTLKDHVILFGAENYYRLVENAR